MTLRNKRSLSKQLKMAYGHNRHSATPLELHLTGIAHAEEHGSEMLPSDGSWRRWRMTQHQQSASEVWPASECVWLSPDAAQPLDGVLDPGATYIIGGIVDPSVRRGLMLECAALSGARTARLPLRENCDLRHGSVLSLYAVVQMLGSVSGGVSWQEAIATSQATGSWWSYWNERQRDKRQAREQRICISGLGVSPRPAPGSTPNANGNSAFDELNK